MAHAAAEGAYHAALHERDFYRAANAALVSAVLDETAAEHDAMIEEEGI